MKRLAIAAVFVILCASAALAEVQDFGKFTINVAEGWTARQQDATAIIVKDDKTASLTVTVDAVPEEAPTAEALTDEFIKSFKGIFKSVGEPEEDSRGNFSWFSWEMTDTRDITTNATLYVRGGNYTLITMTGFDSAGSEMLKMTGTMQEK